MTTSDGNPPEGAGVSRIIERMQDGFFRVMPDGVIQTINPATVDILGYDSAEEIVNKINVKDLWSDPSARDLLLDELRKHGEVTGYEASFKRKDGDVVHLELTIAAVMDADGKLIAQDGTMRDVTKRHQQEQELARSEQQFRSLVKNSPGAIFRYTGGETPTFSYVSDAILDITGYPAEHFIGARDPLVHISHPDDREAAETRRDKVSANRTYQFQQRIITPAGEIRWIQMQGSGSVDPVTGLDTVDGVILDVTETRRVSDELADREQQFQSLIRNVPGAIYRFAEDEGGWRFRYMSPAIEALTGYPPEYFVDRADPFETILHPDDQERVNQAVNEAIATDGDFNFEHRVIHKDGRVRWQRVQGAMERDPVTGWRRVDGVQLDVTDLYEAREAIDASEQQIRSLVGNIPGGIYSYTEKNGEWICTFLTDAVELITGYPPSAFLGKPNQVLLDLILPEDLPTIAAATEGFAEGKAVTYDVRIKRKDGHIRWLNTRASPPLADSTGQLVTYGAMFDVTNAYETRAALERSESTFEHLFESMADGYWVATPAGEIELCNPASAQIFGFPDVETLRSTNTADLWARDEDRVAAGDRLKAERFIENLEVDALKCDGAPFTIAMTARIVGEDDAQRIEMTFRDITRQKQVEEEIRAAQTAAEQANRAKSTFLANMSHELRTPLNAILGYSEMLMEEAENLEDDVFTEDLTKVHSAGAHLLSLINDVLDLSKVEAGRTELLTEDFSIEELVRDVVATTAPLIAKNSNELHVDVDTPKAKLHQDLTKLRQSLLNLISNAAKFTDNGEITLTIRTEQIEAHEWTVVSVADTGIGVAEDKLETLFDEFSQADASTTRQYGGTGLGLAITRRFCRMMGGDVTVSSVEGKGSIFTIRIPSVLTAQSPAPARQSETQRRSPTSVLPTDPLRTVLVIDDDPEACEIIAHHLTRDGFEVVVANGGAEGLEIAREIQPAAITLDVMMPDTDGWSVLKSLKSDERLKNIPVVMVSMVDDRSTGYTLGATSYLTKPVDRQQLLDTIGQHLGVSGEVLVLEDDLNTRSMLARVLKRAGWAVTEAGDGEQGLAAMQRSKPDLILLDLMMPVMDGFDFLMQMRARSEWRDVPVIVVTAKDLTAADHRFLSGRVEQVLAKGAYTRDQLIGLVRGAVAGAVH
jgi:PAS domain S-box-containing protein